MSRRKGRANLLYRDPVAAPYFGQSAPEELLYDEIEQLWAAIAERDDWAPFAAKLKRIEAARLAWDYRQPEA